MVGIQKNYEWGKRCGKDAKEKERREQKAV